MQSTVKLTLFLLLLACRPVIVLIKHDMTIAFLPLWFQMIKTCTQGGSVLVFTSSQSFSFSFLYFLYYYYYLLLLLLFIIIIIIYYYYY